MQARADMTGPGVGQEKQEYSDYFKSEKDTEGEYLKHW